MPRFICLTLGAACLVSCATPTSDTSLSSPVELGWLEGCWVSEDGATNEVWVRGHESLIFGFNTLTNDGELAFFEQMRFQFADGIWNFAAHPRGAAPTLFDAVEFSNSKITVENPDADYPQRIVYERIDDRLTAQISLLDGSRATDWLFEACDD